MIKWRWIARKVGGVTILVCIGLLLTVLIQSGYHLTYWQALCALIVAIGIGVAVFLPLSRALTWLLD
jgi:hypothetical protein